MSFIQILVLLVLSVWSAVLIRRMSQNGTALRAPRNRGQIGWGTGRGSAKKSIAPAFGRRVKRIEATRFYFFGWEIWRLEKTQPSIKALKAAEPSRKRHASCASCKAYAPLNRHSFCKPCDKKPKCRECSHPAKEEGLCGMCHAAGQMQETLEANAQRNMYGIEGRYAVGYGRPTKLGPVRPTKICLACGNWACTTHPARIES